MRTHEALLRLSKQRAELDYEEARLLVAAFRNGVHSRLGYGSFLEYLEWLFGYNPHEARERLRVAQAIEDLPAMAEALRHGALSWSAVRELTRVALPTTERDWIAAAQGRSVREVERLVSGRSLGDRPGDAPAWDARMHVLRLEVTGEVLAAFREAVGQVRREVGSALSEGEALMLMAHRVLASPRDEGSSSYQIALTVCERCEQGWQHGRGELIAVDAQVVEKARCDAQEIGPAHGEAPQRASRTIPPAVRRQVMHRDGGRCIVNGCRSSHRLEVHHLTARHEGGTHEPDKLAVLCWSHHAAVHRGLLRIEGRVSTGLTFRHADGTPYGGRVSPRASTALADAFPALKALGFKDGEARRALDAARSHVGLETAESLVRGRMVTFVRESLYRTRE